MSIPKPPPRGHAGFAAYMASVFSSAARGCSHETAFIAGRIRVKAELGLADPIDALRARRLTLRVRQLEVAARRSSDAGHVAQRAGAPYPAIAEQTSVTLGFRKQAADVLKTARTLEAVVDGRVGGRNAEVTGLVWILPDSGRTVGLRPEQILAWPASANANDQVMLLVKRPDLAIQIERPARDLAIWPWTVRVGKFYPGERGEGVDIVTRDNLLARHFVSHGGEDLWCHVAPADPAAFKKWVTEISATLGNQL